MPPKKQIVPNNDYAEENRIASGWLLHYADRLTYHAIRRQESEEATVSALGGDGQPRGSDISDPTAKRALELATEDIEKTEAWLAVIREVEDEIFEIKLRVWLTVRREFRGLKGRHEWLPRAARRYGEEMAKELGMPEEKVYRSDSMLLKYWDVLVDFTVRKAIRRGLLPLRDEEGQRSDNGQ